MIRKPFVEACKYLKKHPHVLVPKLVYLAVTAFIAFLLRDSFVILGNALEGDVFDFALLTSPEVTTATMYVAVYGVFMFFFNIAFSAIVFGLIDDIMKKDKCLLKHCKNHLRNYYMPVFYTRLWMGLIYLLGAIISFVPPMLLSSIGYQKYSLPSFIGAATLIYIGISLILLFRHPILVREKVKPRIALKRSFDYFRKNPKYTFIVAVTMLAVASLVPLVAKLIEQIGIAPLNLITIALEFIIGMWIFIFLFSSYYFSVTKKTRKKKK